MIIITCLQNAGKRAGAKNQFHIRGGGGKIPERGGVWWDTGNITLCKIPIDAWYGINLPKSSSAKS